MTDLLEVSLSSIELADLSCPVCQDDFNIGQQVVQCPVCGCWHHFECWRYNSYHCSTLGCPGSGRLQSQSVPSTSDETDTISDDIIIEQAPVFIDILSMSDPALLGEIVILEDVSVFDTVNLNAQTSLDNGVIGSSVNEEISIELWELGLDEFLKKRKFSGLLEKTGVQKAIKRYVKGKDYYIAVGVVAVWALVLLIISIIVIFVVGFTLFG